MVYDRPIARYRYDRSAERRPILPIGMMPDLKGKVWIEDLGVGKWRNDPILDYLPFSPRRKFWTDTEPSDPIEAPSIGMILTFGIEPK